MKSNKGAMSLSIQSIVVIVVGLVVLGLALTFTTNIFRQAESEIPRVFEYSRFSVQPSSDNPITVPETIELNRKKSRTMEIGFYNSRQGTATNAILDIKQCKSEGDSGSVDSDKVPSITALSANVPVSETRGYSIIISENGLPAGTYICEMGVRCENDCPTWMDSEHYATKNFFLRVKA